MTIDDIVEAFGGRHKFTAALGLTTSHIDYWIRVGYVPKKKHELVLAAAIHEGVRLSQADLTKLMEAANPRPLGGNPTARDKTPEVIAMDSAGMMSRDIATELSISYSSVRRIITGRKR